MADDIATNRYPKHVWSPAGGWYAQPKNWRANTAIMLGVVVGITAMAWSVSAEREHRYKMPEVCLPSMDAGSNGGHPARELRSDSIWNSLTGSRLRDTGRGRLGSTRLHRRPRPVARDPHRNSKAARVRCGIMAFLGNSMTRAAVGKTFVHMRRSELTSSTNVVRLAGLMVCMFGGTGVVILDLQYSNCFCGNVPVFPCLVKC